MYNYFRTRTGYDSESSDDQSDDSGVTDESQIRAVARKNINKGRWSKEEV